VFDVLGGKKIMSWRDLEAYQKLLEIYPKLEDEQHREAFEQYMAQMWVYPTTYEEFLQAYLEFTTPQKPDFKKLDAQMQKSQEDSKATEGASKRNSSRSRRRRGRRRKRSG